MFRIGSRQACLLTGIVALGATSAAHASGFYFSVFGGVDNFDLPYSRADLDDTFTDVLSSFGFGVTGSGSKLDESGTIWGAQIGYAVNDYVAVEVGYVNLGRSKYEGQFLINGGAGNDLAIAKEKFASRGPTIAAVGVLPLPLDSQRFNIHGRAGVLFSRTDVSLHFDDINTGDSSGVGFHSSDRDLFFGVGADWNFSTSYSLRVEYTRFSKVGSKDDTGEANINALTIGVLFR